MKKAPVKDRGKEEGREGGRGGRVVLFLNCHNTLHTHRRGSSVRYSYKHIQSWKHPRNWEVLVEIRVCNKANEPYSVHQAETSSGTGIIFKSS